MKDRLAVPVMSIPSISLPITPVRDTSKKNTILKSHGRPPWYDERGQRISDAFVVGIAARQIVEALGSVPTVVILSQCLKDLKDGKQSNIPIYSFKEHQRLEVKKYLYGATIIIVALTVPAAEGIMALTDPPLRSLYDLKIFVQCDSDLMLARRMKRDVTERDREVEGILDYKLLILRRRRGSVKANISQIVPGSDNNVAIELVSTHIRRQLAERATPFRKNIVVTPIDERLSFWSTGKEHEALIVLPQTHQLKGIYTIIRDQTTNKQDFIFFVDRLAMFLVEKAMEQLPYRAKTVTTPIGAEAVGKELDTKARVVHLRRIHLAIVSASIHAPADADWTTYSGGPLEKGL
ncbi:hypothetical protein HWV62_26929 [Athelia sp. TMB]|nr:hypothetical protein HWV62_26929 [Athelia sp. TMB]